MAASTPSSQHRVSVAGNTFASSLPKKVLGAALGAVAAVPWLGSSTNLLGLATLFTSAIVCGPSAWALSIDTTPSWDGSSGVALWGPTPATQSYGQVITPNSAGSLTDFTFYISPITPDPIFYQARVYQWDDRGTGFGRLTGPSIYNSGTLSFSGTSGDFSEVTINTGGVSLSASTPYVLFFSTVGETQTVSNATIWGFLSSDEYSGGDFVYYNDPAYLTGLWDISTGTDLAFKANIADAVPSNVPGPLPILGLAAAFGFSRKLRKRIKLHKGTSDISSSAGA